MKNSLKKTLSVAMCALSFSLVALGVSGASAAQAQAASFIPGWNSHDGVGPVTSIIGEHGVVPVFPGGGIGIPGWGLHDGVGPVTGITGPDGSIIRVLP